MLNKMIFEHYKAFAGYEELELRPITLVVGKNSSGKSSVLKLLPMLSNMVSGRIQYPLLLNNNGIINATTYEDLSFRRENTGLRLGLQYDNGLTVLDSYLFHDGILDSYLYEVFFGDKHFTNQYGDSKTEQYGLVNPLIFDELGIDSRSLIFECNYIGPFRVVAPHNVVFKGFDNTIKIGYNGAEAYQLLLNSYRTDKVLFNQVSQWMEANLEGQSLDFSNVNNNFGTFTLTVKHNDYLSSVTEVGQGVAQVLPIITQSFVSNQGSINIMEQPALHLHPAAHSKVAYRLGLSAKERGCKYVIESHSENLLLGFRHLVVNPQIDFSPEDIVIYFVDSDEDGASLSKITIDERGELSDWPSGVFGESFDLLRQIMQMRTR